ncbi:AlkA N-terminal domain-containing protein [Pseudomonas sp. HR96]|uniref:DNA-3-methyladenine glycosylase family protein n=1 Tax=Pseudomonas sp. HR96 TaxID=1027966 RepID=UPI002A74BC99|nr:AlkA N-terminal domain-containing protein [Pseudomonas sp. HR96]WPO98230.1 AlkA N-terminal domain-containing protein [Pseudomonas sp. HR96]
MKIISGQAVAELELFYPPPLDWQRMLRFFGGRSTAGVESVVDGVYHRTLRWQGSEGLLSVRQDPARHCLIATLHGEVSRQADAVSGKLASLFDLATEPALIQQCFASDPWLGQLIAQAPGLRVPGAWSGFELVVRTIVGQQVSVKAATTIVGRLVQRAGTPAQGPLLADAPWLFPTPEALAGANLDRIGMPGKRVAALQGFAQAVADGVVDIDAATPDLPTLRRQLLALPGIGPWTVEYTAMRAWRDADAWPGTDLVLMQAIARRQPELLKHAQQLKHSEAWRPWRAYAAMHLWNEIADAAGAARGG